MARARRLVLPVLAAAVALALIQSGNARYVWAAGLGLLVLAVGRAVFAGYRHTKGPTGPPRDVDDGDGLLVFACETCGEQLILLRKGTDVPPRHCADPMVLRRVPVPDLPAQGG
jgi:hypothetical protein